MADKSVVPWHQYAAISYVAERAQGSPSLGKTAMQKLISLIQELAAVPIGYRFRIYNYGPYSSDLAEDVTYVEFLQGITVDFDSAQKSYNIKPSEKSQFLIGKAGEFISYFKDKMDNVLQEFGHRKARELELISTIVYMSRILQAMPAYSEQRLADQVQEIKPKFRAEEIQQAIKDLRDNKHVA